MTCCGQRLRLLQSQRTFWRNFSVAENERQKRKDGGFPPAEAFKSIQECNEMVGIKRYRETFKHIDPFSRTINILKNDMRYIGYKTKTLLGFDAEMHHDVKAQFFPTHTDVVIIGGGAIASSIAYWLKQRAPNALNVIVIEPEMTAASYFAGGLRQQFSLPENVAMSLFGAEFMRNIAKYLTVEGFDKPNVEFQPHGYLLLATAEDLVTLKENSTMQRKMGTHNILLTASKLKKRFPWLNTDGIELGCLGLENEGWFNPWSLLSALKQKNLSLGVDYVQADVIGFEFKHQPYIIVPSAGKQYEQLDKVIVELPGGTFQTIKFANCVLAAGAQSSRFARMAGIGEKDGLLSFPLPVEPRKRYVYRYSCPDGPGINTPVVVDPSGAYFRREQLTGFYTAGMSLFPSHILPDDQTFFEQEVWSVISKRVPALKKMNPKPEGLETEVCECNIFDENGIIGVHPYYHNLYFATGFNQGIQHSPAVGRAIMELLLDGEYKTIDLSRLGFNRLCLGEPVYEKNIC